MTLTKTTKLHVGILIAIVLIVLVIPTASAWELTPTKLDFKDSISSDMSDFIKQDYNSKYGALTFSNTILGLIDLNKEAEYSLISNTDYCIENCSATIKATLYSDGVLIDYFDAKDITGNLVQIKDQKTYINVKEEYQTDIPATYKDVCVLVTDNKTSLKEKKCHKEIATYQIGEREVQQEYKGEIVKAGNYIIQIIGTKQIGVNADWGIGVRGVSADEVRKSWETWTSADCIAGGTITIDGDFCVNTYLVSNTFNVSRAIHNFSVLVVAGGGGGGSEQGGGGGAGGLKLNTTYVPTGNLNVIIGTGGLGAVAVANTNGKRGGNSSFGEIVSFGGGGGRTRNAGALNTSGGSGGGGAGYENKDHGNGTAGQGYDGGIGYSGGGVCGGGGGSFQLGVDGASGVGGNGGNGTATNINGTWICLAGGGGGCGDDGATTGFGFCGGGRGGGNLLSTMTAGQNGTGSGGGGTSGGAGGNYGASGGSGIVIARYLAEKPSITLTQVNPIDEYNSTALTNYFGCSATAGLSSISNVTLTIRHSNGTLEYAITNTTIYGATNFTNFSYTFTEEGKYSWNCTGRNDNNDYGTTANRNINVTTPSPILNITSPLNNTATSQNNLEINYTIIDTDLTDCFWSKNSGATNTTLANCGTNITGQTWSEGANTIIIWANDSRRHKVSKSVYFSVDTTYPIVTITRPINNSNLNYNNVEINYTLTELNPSSCFWSNTSGAVNISITCGTNITGKVWNQGGNTIQVWANDTLNHLNSTSVYFFVDSIYPVVTITSPANNTNWSVNNIQINYTVSDTNINSCWWSKNFGASNTSITCGTNITGQTWTQGNNNITIWANDTLNNINRSDVYFLVDTSAPIITILSPTNNKIYTAIQNIDLNYSATDANPITCAFAIDGGTNTSTSCATNTTINTTVGDHSVIVYATDSFGNVGSSSQINFTNVNITTAETYSTAAVVGTTQVFSITLNRSNSLEVRSIFYYNNTAYPLSTINLSEWNYSLVIPNIPGMQANNSFKWAFNLTYRGTTLNINSTPHNQIVDKLVFALCNTSVNNTFINFSFANEVDNTAISASFNNAQFYYWLSTLSRSTNQSLLFINNTINPSYTFCVYPSYATIIADYEIQYSSNDSGTYPQRRSSVVSNTFTNSTSNVSLYLLKSTDGIYSSILTASALGNPISGVTVTVSRMIGGIVYTIGKDVTDSAGVVTFWVNPNADHTVTASKSGYSDTTITWRPSQSIYTLLFGSSSEGRPDSNYYFRGITYKTYPPLGVLYQYQNYTFMLNITEADDDNLLGCRLVIRNENFETVGTASGCLTSLSSGFAAASINVSNHSNLFASYYVDIGDGMMLMKQNDAWVVDVNYYGDNVSRYGLWQIFQSLSYDNATRAEFGETHNRQEFSIITMFFFGLVIVFGALNKQIGFDMKSPGVAIGVIYSIIFVASLCGFFQLNGLSRIVFIEKYGILLILTTYTIGYFINKVRKETV